MSYLAAENRAEAEAGAVTEAEILALPYRPCVGLMLIEPGGAGLRRAAARQPRARLADAAGRHRRGRGAARRRRCASSARRPASRPTAVEVLAETPDWITYDLPHELVPRIWKGRFRGQRQRWFLMRFLGDDALIDIATAHPEFRAWAWMEPQELVERDRAVQARDLRRGARGLRERPGATGDGVPQATPPAGRQARLIRLMTRSTMIAPIAAVMIAPMMPPPTADADQPAAASRRPTAPTMPSTTLPARPDAAAGDDLAGEPAGDAADDDPDDQGNEASRRLPAAASSARSMLAPLAVPGRSSSGQRPPVTRTVSASAQSVNAKGRFRLRSTTAASSSAGMKGKKAPSDQTPNCAVPSTVVLAAELDQAVEALAVDQRLEAARGPCT